MSLRPTTRQMSESIWVAVGLGAKPPAVKPVKSSSKMRVLAGCGSSVVMVRDGGARRSIVAPLVAPDSVTVNSSLELGRDVAVDRDLDGRVFWPSAKLTVPLAAT